MFELPDTQILKKSTRSFSNRTFLLELLSLYIVLLSAAATRFSASPVSVLFLTIFTALILFKYFGSRWLKDKVGVILVLGFALVLLVHYFISGMFAIGSLKFFGLLLSIFYLVRYLKARYLDSLFLVIEKMVWVTLPFYLIQVVAEEALISILSPFNVSALPKGLNVFVFNISGWALGMNFLGIPRNSGFMWEPGAFGAVLIFLLVYKYRKEHGQQITRSMKMIMLYALTTLSTATYVGLAGLLMIWIIRRYRKNLLKLAVFSGIAVAVAVPVYNLPFMKGKIEYYMENNLDYKLAYEGKQVGDKSPSIGRFAGFLIELERIKHRPILGYGWDNSYEHIGIGAGWSNPNGLAVLLGKFGLVGVLFILFGSFRIMPDQIKPSFLIRLGMVILMLMPVFSNPFQYNIIFWTLVMLGFEQGVSGRDLHLSDYRETKV